MAIRTGLLLLFIWLGHTALARPKPKVLPIDSDFTKNTLFGYTYLLSDRSQTIQINELLTDTINRYDFRLANNEILNIGFAPWPHWVKCQITSKSSREQPLIFGVDFAQIDDISFYIVDEHQKIIYKQEHLSRKTSIADRPIVSRRFAFPVNLKPNQTLTLYCQAYRQKSVLLLPITLFSKREFVENGFTFDLLLSLGLGILLISFLTSFSLYVVTKKNILLYYAGYVLSYGIASLSLVGIWSHYVANLPLLDENVHLVMFGIAGFTQLNFTIEFLQLRHLIGPKWLTGIKLFAFLSLLAGLYVLVAPFSYMNSVIISGIGLVIQIVVFGLVIFGLSRLKYEAMLYLIGFLPLFIVISWFAITILLHIDRSWLFYQLGYTIPFVQIVVLGIGIGLQLIRGKEESLLAIRAMKQQQVEHILNAQETERRRIAQDLHDDIGTSLIALRGQLPAWEATAHQLLTQIITDVRAVSHNLMPDELATLGLADALNEASRRLQEASGMPILFVCAGDIIALTQVAELAVYRAVLELMHNLIRHSGATQAIVQLVYHTDVLNITVEDNGQGFVEKNKQEVIGIGLKNVASRTDWLGGQMAIDTSPAGTTIRLDIPYV